MILIPGLVTMGFAFMKAGKITGRWEASPSPAGNITAAVFREDSSFEGYINKTLFVSGTYSFSPADSVLTVIDNGCNGLTGFYKILFFSKSDSLRFAVIRDNCEERKQEMEGLIMGRIKYPQFNNIKQN